MNEKEVSCVKEYIDIIEDLAIERNIDKVHEMLDLIKEFEEERIKKYNEIGDRIIKDKSLKEKLSIIIKSFHQYYLFSVNLDKYFMLDGKYIKDIPEVVEYLYRGVYNGEKFNLLPGCFRDGNYKKEDKYYHYIKSRCSNDFNNKNHLDTLVTLQHYDCPTRLLDVTFNPLVALYFACKNYGCSICDRAPYGYVYVFAEPRERILFKDSDRVIMLSCLARFNHKELMKMHNYCANLIIKQGINAILESDSNNREIDKLYHEIRTEIDFEKRIYARDLLQTFFVQPDYSNKRIDKQNGAFIISGLSKDQKEIEDKIKCGIHTRIKVINQNKILKELDKLNINEATLFPELDKVSKYYIDKISKEY